LALAVRARQARILRMLAAISSSAVNKEQAAMPRTRRRPGWARAWWAGSFGVAVESFDGVAQGGVAGVPGGAGVGQVLAVAGAGVGRDGDRGLPADLGWFVRRLEDLGTAVAGG
jgi:hypothetical protein